MHIKSTKPAQNSILQLSNYYLQNLTNWDAAIQIFLNLYKLNSTIFHSYVTFHLTVAQYNTTIFVHRVFSHSHKLKFLCLGTNIPQNTFYVTRSFFDWLKLKIFRNEFHKFSFVRKSTWLFLSTSDRSSCWLLKIIECNQSFCFISNHKQSKQFPVLGLCLNLINFCSLGRWYLKQWCIV